MKQKRPSAESAEVSPAEFRARFPAVLDQDYHDLISVQEAADIMRCTPQAVRKAVRQGRLKGKILTTRSYVISLAAARANAVAYERRTNAGHPRGPRG